MAVLMNNKIKRFMLLLASVLFVFLFAACEKTEINNSYSEIYEKEPVSLEVDENGDFRVIKINDTHFTNGYCEDDMHTLADIKVVLDKTPCDLIIVNGDMVEGAGFNLHYEKYRAVSMFASLIEEYKIPWTFAPGNNDGERGGSNEDLIAYLMQYEHFICGNKEGIDGSMQFFIDLTSNGRPVHTIAVMDSLSRTVKVIGKYDYIKESQINYLLEGIDERKTKTSVFFHMPTPEFQSAIDFGEDYDGYRFIKLFPVDNIKKNNLFDDMTKDNEYISLISTAHVHGNDMATLYNNRYYQLSSCTGYGALGANPYRVSCTLTVIHTNETDVKDLYDFQKVYAVDLPIIR